MRKPIVTRTINCLKFTYLAANNKTQKMEKRTFYTYTQPANDAEALRLIRRGVKDPDITPTAITGKEKISRRCYVTIEEFLELAKDIEDETERK